MPIGKAAPHKKNRRSKTGDSLPAVYPLNSDIALHDIAQVILHIKG
jgi:hypothetical protein